MSLFRFLLLIVALVLANVLDAQNSFKSSNVINIPGKNQSAVLKLKAVDVDNELRSDQNKENPRIANALSLEANLLEEKYLLNESASHLVYGLFIEDDNGKGLCLGLRDLNLSQKANIYIKDLEHNQEDQLWPILSSNGNLLTKIYPGNELFISIQIPKTEKDKSRVELSTAYQLFEKRYADQVQTQRMDTGFEASSICQVNAACSPSEKYPNAKKSVVRILMVLEEGLGFCSGSLMNNTAEDRTPYILTAFHCQTGFTPIYDMWRFDFEYESDDCSTPLTEPNYLFTTGCSYIAGRDLSDFMLLKLDITLPSTLDVWYNGWDNRDNYVPDSTAMFHHPSGDIKKISVDYDPLTIFPVQINWTGGLQTPADYHYRALYEIGTQQPGSSGSPLLDPQERVIGQLHGGFVDTLCTNILGYYGRFYRSWDFGTTPDTRLEDWLDPLGLGVSILDGRSNDSDDVIVSGRIETTDQEGVANVVINLQSGGVLTQVSTDDFGQFTATISNVLEAINITASKTTLPSNGLTGIDILQLRRHILGIQPLVTNEQLIAADFNGSGTISAIDIFNMQQLILGKINQIPNNQPSWKFLPENIAIPIGANSSDLNFIGIKIGDINLSADPKL